MHGKLKLSFSIPIVLMLSIGMTHAADVEDALNEQVRGDLLRGDLVDLLDHAELIAIEMGLPATLIEQIRTGRDEAIMAPDQAYMELAPHLADMVEHLRGSAERRSHALLADPIYAPAPSPGNGFAEKAPGRVMSLQPGTGTPFPDREHFEVDWSFQTDTPTEEPGGDDSARTENGRCTTPGPTESQLIGAKRDEIISYSVKVTAERFCAQTVLGINLSLACIPTDIVYFVFKAISESQQLCGDIVGRSDNNALFDGMEFVHNQLQQADAGLKLDIDVGSQTTIENVNDSYDAISDALTSAEESVETSIETTTTNVETSIGVAEDKLDTRISALETQVLDTANEAEQKLTELVNERGDRIDASLNDTAEFIADFAALNLRVQIEANLAEQGRPQASFKPIASLQIEQFMSLVNDIVRETIDRMVAAGETTNNAENHFSTAGELLAAGDFEEAYKWLGLAYQAAVR